MFQGVQPRRVITQPVEDREALAGWQPPTPYSLPHSTPIQSVNIPVPIAVNEDADISIRKAVHNELPTEVQDARRQRKVFCSSPSVSMSSDDEGGEVVDMRQHLQLSENIKIRRPGVSNSELGIEKRTLPHASRCHAVDDFLDLKEVEELEELPLKGYVTVGDADEICELLTEKPKEKGIICNSEVLHCEEGLYEEGRQYKVMPDTLSKGAYGEAAMCQDLNTGKTFMLKKVRGKLSENEVRVPLMFTGNPGIPEVYGVVCKNQETEIFQQFAGMSMKKLIESEYAEKLRSPSMVLVLALQAFATLDKLHSQGVTHQDIKPENLCIDVEEKNWRLKIIDFGSSQTATDQVTEGLTNEYLSPESCAAIMQVAMNKISREQGRLGPANDVWAMALSLLYCLCGYHVMVYVCTGDTQYRDKDPTMLQQKRIQCLFQIMKLREEDVVSKMIHVSWPPALRTLLYNTLRVNPADRWTARQASHFILSTITKSVCPVQSPVVNPSRLAVRPTYAVQDQEEESSSPASPASSTPSSASCVSESLSAQLPAFTDLLPDEDCKKTQRCTKRRQRDGPYPQLAGRGFKVIRK